MSDSEPFQHYIYFSEYSKLNFQSINRQKINQIGLLITNYKLKNGNRLYKKIALQLNLKTDFIEKYIKDCIQYGLFKNDNGYLYSESFLARMEKYEKRKKAARKAANARWNNNSKANEKQKDSKSNAKAMRPHSDSNASKVNKSKANKNKEKESKNNNIANNEQQILNIFQKIKNYPFDFDRDLEYIRELADEYPDANLLDQAKRWKIYKLDNPLKENHNPRSQFHKWVKNRKNYQNNPDTKEDEAKKIEERKKKQQEMVNKYG